MLLCFTVLPALGFLLSLLAYVRDLTRRDDEDEARFGGDKMIYRS